MVLRSLQCLVPLWAIACALGAAPLVLAADPWEEDIRKFEQADEQTPPPANPILFVGSSTIRLWDVAKWFPDQPVINRGFGGSTVADVVRYVDRIVLKYKPRAIVFYSGDNDIAGGKTPEQVAADFTALLKAIRAAKPTVPVIFLPTKPSIQRWSLVEKMRDSNRRIKTLGDSDPNLIYADTSTPMLGDDGKPRAELFQADGLHLSDAGYKLWTSIVKPLLETK